MKKKKFFSLCPNKKAEILKDLYKEDLRKININKYDKIEEMAELERQKNRLKLNVIFSNIPYEIKIIAKKLDIEINGK